MSPWLAPGRRRPASQRALRRLVVVVAILTAGLGALFASAPALLRQDSGPLIVVTFAALAVGVVALGVAARTLSRHSRRLDEILESAPALERGASALEAADEVDAVAAALDSLRVRVAHSESELERRRAVHRADSERLTAALEEARALVRDARRERDEVAVSRGELLGRACRELRDPLQGIHGLAQLLAQSEPGSARGRHARLIGTTAARLLRHVEDTRDFVRLESGRLTLSARRVRPRRLLQEVLHDPAFASALGRVELVGEVAPDVPEQVVVDGERLRLVLSRLVGNALKFTESGEVRVSLGVSRREGLRLDACVRDSGPGLARDELVRVFEPFVQGGSSEARRHPGLGLGLAVVRGVVKAMNGSCRVESRPGEGSAFHVAVPVVAADVTDAGCEPLALAGRRAVLALRSRTACRALARVLEASGMEVGWCDGAAQLLAPPGGGGASGPSGGPVEALVVDRALPGALEAGRDLRAAGLARHLVAVVLPGEEHDLGEGDGVDGVLAKPVGELELVDLLSRLASGEPPVPSATPSGAVDGGACGLRTLVADADPASQAVAVALLEGAGHRVTIADRGRDALGLLCSGGFDLALVDCRLPGLSGFDVATALRESEWGTGRHVPVIGLAGDSQEPREEDCLRAGMDARLVKPLRVEPLCSAIARLVRAAGSVVGSGSGSARPVEAASVVAGRDGSAAAGRGGSMAAGRDGPAAPARAPDSRPPVAPPGRRPAPGEAGAWHRLVDDLPVRAEQLRRAVLEEDHELLAREATELAASLARLGGTRAYRLALALRDAAGVPVEGRLQLLGELERALEEILESVPVAPAR